MKSKLKSEIFEKRKALSKEEVKLKSDRIKERLYSLEDFQKAKNVLFYVSFNNEVDTTQIIQDFLENSNNINYNKNYGKNNKDKSNKKIIVPYIIKNNPLLQLSELRSMDNLEPKTFGILEPKDGKIIKFDAGELDLVIVPGIAFDKRGHRVGYGRGHYDRLLEKLDKKIKKMALAFDFQLIDRVPEEKHDVPMDFIITENEIIKCNLEKSI